MTTPTARDAADVRVSADRRLGPYTVLVVAGLVAALVTGDAVFAAVAAPVAVLVALALADRRPVCVEVASIDAPDRRVEGDRWTLEIELAWRGRAEIDVLHSGVAGHGTDGATGWRIESSDGATVRVEVEAAQWGRHGLGVLDVRARRPGGMLVFDQRIDLPGTVRVLPRAGRLDSLLHPWRPRVAAGGHVAPVRGSGSDLADLRPYVPGDRLRDLSWTASARSDQPWVVVHHPERTATVVLVLDGFVEVGAPAGSLDRAARVVWAVARHHLDNGDRVGLLAGGAHPRWLAPAAGRRARYLVLDALLSVGTDLVAPSARRSRGVLGREVALPADAFVVGVSPLQSDAFVAGVLHHVRAGHPAVVIGVETGDLLAPATDEVERAARRLWAVDAELRRATLSRAGVPSAMVGDDVAAAVRVLARRGRRRARVSA